MNFWSKGGFALLSADEKPGDAYAFLRQGAQTCTGVATLGAHTDANANITQGAQTCAGTAVADAFADASIAQGAQTVSGTAQGIAQGDASIVQGAQTVSGTAQGIAQGDASIVQGAQTCAGTATVVSPITLTSMIPNVGFSDGGTAITITGTGFSGSPAVSVGGSACSSVVVVNSTTITAVTGTHSGTGGNQNLTLQVDSATLANQFEVFDPINLPGGGTALVWLSARHVTTIAGPKASAASDVTGNGHNASCTAGHEIVYIASDASFAGYPCFNQLNSANNGALEFASNPVGAGNRSFCMVGFGDPTAGQNYWWNCGGTDEGVIFPAPKNWSFTTDGSAHVLSWSNATVAITTPGVIVACCDGAATTKLRINAQTAVSGNAGTLTNLSGTAFSVGSRGPANVTQNVNGKWTDFLLYASKLSDSDAQYLELGFGKIYSITIAA